MHPVLLQIGPITLRWYGFMIAVSCMTGLWIAQKEAGRKQIDPENIKDFFVVALLASIAGARLYYIAFTGFSLFWENPASILAVWQGGMAIHGAILGGLLTAVFYTRRHKISFWKFADTLAPSLILGQALGRIGCFLNGDAHGYPTDLPWGMIYNNESPAGMMYPGQPLHPTQLYEMVLNLIIFMVLWKIRKQIKTDGRIFLLYVILYSAGRIFVESFRADKLLYMGNFSVAQSIGVLGILTGLVLMTALPQKS